MPRVRDDTLQLAKCAANVWPIGPIIRSQTCGCSVGTPRRLAMGLSESSPEEPARPARPRTATRPVEHCIRGNLSSSHNFCVMVICLCVTKGKSTTEKELQLRRHLQFPALSEPYTPEAAPRAQRQRCLRTVHLDDEFVHMLCESALRHFTSSA